MIRKEYLTCKPWAVREDFSSYRSLIYLEIKDQLLFFSSSKIKDRMVNLLRNKPVITAIPFGLLFSPICIIFVLFCSIFFKNLISYVVFLASAFVGNYKLCTLFMYFKSTAPNCSWRYLIVSGKTLNQPYYCCCCYCFHSTSSHATLPVSRWR